MLVLSDQMDLTKATLERFDKDPLGCEKLLREAADVDPSSLALSLTAISRPGSDALTHVRLLSLTLLSQILEEKWSMRPLALKRAKQLPLLLSQEAKDNIMSIILSDLFEDTNNGCVYKRSQCIAAIARFEWQTWTNLFKVLTQLVPDDKALDQANCFQLVLESIGSSQRNCSSQMEYRKLGSQVYPRIFHHLSRIFQRTINFEHMTDGDALLATRLCKIINTLITTLTAVDELALGPYFEIVLASLSLRPCSNPTRKLLHALRQSCLVLVRNHPLLFKDFFLTVFADRTSSTLLQISGPFSESLPDEENIEDNSTSNSSVGTLSGEKDAVIFCFAFWTELMIQKKFQVPIAEAIDRFLAPVVRQALVFLRLSAFDAKEWARKGGEIFCALDDCEMDPPFMHAPEQEDSARRAARRFLYSCLEQPLPTRADVVVSEVFGTIYADALAIEAAFLVVQLSSARLHGKFNFDEFFRGRLVSYLASSHSRTEDAILARRVCHVIRYWVRDLSQDSITILLAAFARTLAQPSEKIDSGYAMAVFECAHALIEVVEVGLPSALILSQFLSISAVTSLLHSFRLAETKSRFINFIEALVFLSRKSEFANEVIVNIAPLGLVNEGTGLVANAAIDLAATCVQITGMRFLTGKTKSVVSNLIQISCNQWTPSLDESWSRLMLICLRTAETPSDVMSIIRLESIQYVSNLKMRCILLETALRLCGSGSTVDTCETMLYLRMLYQRLTRDVRLLEEGKFHETFSPCPEKSETFEILHVSRCLQLLARTTAVPCQNQEASHLWNLIVNSSEAILAADANLDPRDVIEQVCVIARVLLCKLGRFTSVSQAIAFAVVCIKYLDSLGYAPSEAPSRRRTWAFALLLTLSMCRVQHEIQLFLPIVIQVCYIVACQAESEDDYPAFSDIVDDPISAELDHDKRRKERMFAEDPFVRRDIRSEFHTVWRILLSRFGHTEVFRILEDSEEIASQMSRLLGETIVYNKNAIQDLLV